ncbi:MAG: hypothetical protein ACRD3W_09590 [Terriglobales bacterium]
MTPNVQVGTILIEGRPLVTRVLDLGRESYSAKWVVLKVLDKKLRSVGWNCSFVAEEAEATVFGSLTAQNVQKALKRIFLKMRKQDFNCLEVTKMVENSFLGVPYITVCTHPHQAHQS